MAAVLVARGGAVVAAEAAQCSAAQCTAGQPEEAQLASIRDRNTLQQNVLNCFLKISFAKKELRNGCLMLNESLLITNIGK